MKPALHALALSALLALAACSGSNSPTHFDTGGGGAVGGNGAGGASSGSGSGSGSGSTGTTTTGTTSSTTGTGGSTGQPLGNITADLHFLPQTVIYQVLQVNSASGANDARIVEVQAYEKLLGCGDLSNPAKVAGHWFVVGVSAPGTTVPGAGQYNVTPADGGPSVFVSEGELFPDGGSHQDYATGPAGTLVLSDDPGAWPMGGNFDVQATGGYEFIGNFTAQNCP